MSILPGHFSSLLFGSQSNSNITLTSVATPAANTTSQTTYTFSSVSFGTEASDRVTIVGFVSRANASGRGINSVTINGVSATYANVGSFTDASNSDFAGIYYAENPTGTTGDVVITFNAAMLRCSLQVLKMVGQVSSAPYNIAADNTGDPLDGNVNVVSGGCAYGVSSFLSGSTNASWTGLTESIDATLSGTHQWSTALDNFVAAETPRTVNINLPGSPTNQCLSAVSWA